MGQEADVVEFPRGDEVTGLRARTKRTHGRDAAQGAISVDRRQHGVFRRTGHLVVLLVVGDQVEAQRVTRLVGQHAAQCDPVDGIGIQALGIAQVTVALLVDAGKPPIEPVFDERGIGHATDLEKTKVTAGGMKFGLPPVDRLVLDDLDGADLGTTPEQCTLGPLEHLHALDVE